MWAEASADGGPSNLLRTGLGATPSRARGAPPGGDARRYKSTHNPKLIGERAELLFMYEAASRGFIVSKPFGDSASYDAIVQSREKTPREPKEGARGAQEYPGKMWRVQVRSVMRRNGRSYKVDCRTGCRRRKMTPDDADFLAAYCGPEEQWYIIPVRAFAPCNHISLFPHVKESEGRWERYRDAWETMR